MVLKRTDSLGSSRSGFSIIVAVIFNTPYSNSQPYVLLYGVANAIVI